VDERRPDRATWTAWAAVLLGGLAVLAAVALALRDPCLGEGDAPTLETLEACAAGTLLGVVTALTIGGTTLAVLGGIGAALLAVRRLSRRTSERADG
jgi:hypothetical protein